MRTSLLFFLILCTCAGMAQSNIPLNQNQANGDDNYSHVKPGDNVYIQTGSRGALVIQNFHGTEDEPIVFLPSDWSSAVEISSNNYGISIRNCSHIRLTGWQGVSNKYGIRITNVTESGSVGIGVGDKSTDFEIDNIEIGFVDFAGILAKTEPKCDDLTTHRGAFVQKNTIIHNCFIHDTGGEGIYVGSSFFQGQELANCFAYPHLLEGVYIYENRVERTGWDGIQVGCAHTKCFIHDNELVDCSLLEEIDQRSGIVIGGGTLADCYNNVIKDCRATGILAFGDGGTRIFNNLIIRPGLKFTPEDPDQREHGIYMDDKTRVDDSFRAIFSNTIIQPKSDGVRISSSVASEVVVYNNLIVDPGAWVIYENDNTSRTGNDSFIFAESPDQTLTAGSNAFVRSLTEPKFVNANLDDFHLSEDSEHINSGRDLAGHANVNFDLENKPRPLLGKWDIGAFEFGSSSIVATNALDEVPVHVFFSETSELVVKVISPTELRWQVISITGQILSQSPIAWYDRGDFHITMDDLYNGIGFIRIVGNNWHVSKKLVLN